ncbi:hypothetical protein [Amycolatopsis sp. La24]|uniref:hypothetical protein n=1 Tax=Amycolatopsis sp. La24 TaxID=3028304 RepID=UPI00056191A6|nr:hypothetical protein [Amycolatopsis sp. La24]
MRLGLRLVTSRGPPTAELTHAHPVHERTRHRRILFRRKAIAESRKPHQVPQHGNPSRDLTQQTRDRTNPSDRLLDAAPDGRPPLAKLVLKRGQLSDRLRSQTSNAFRCGA